MKEVTSSYHANKIENQIQEFWERDRIFEKTVALRSGGKDFFFVDGPPYTTGHIHLGTAWNKIIKDSVLRYHRMTGRNVIARAGYDMHGLPIEVRVEQQLGFSSKKDIERYGIDAFIDKCRTFAKENLEGMSRQFESLGVWMDFDDPYQTITPDYIEAAWWAIKRADEEKMLERGYRVVNWCPRCATAIADAEVEYWDETDPSIYVKFPLEGKEHEYLVIWTTTPWTLPANVAVAVHPDIVYAEVEGEKDGKKEVLWMAEDLVEAVLRKARYKSYNILSKRPGTELTGLVYHSPLADEVPLQNAISHKVVTADFVTLENTGMVHIAPGHGWDDYVLGCKEGLAIVCPVDATGTFTEEAGSLSGKYVRDANPVVLEQLEHHLMAEEAVTHRYGHCWRCKTPIIFRRPSNGSSKPRISRSGCSPRWRRSPGSPSGPEAPGSMTGSRRRGTGHLPAAVLGIPIPSGMPHLRDEEGLRYDKGTRGRIRPGAPRPPPPVRRPHHLPLLVRGQDAPGGRHLRCMVRLRGRILGHASLSRADRGVRPALAG